MLLLVVSQIKLLITASIAFVLVSSVSTLASHVAAEQSSTTKPTPEVNTLLPCQPDSELNTLLVQMLVALHPYLILHQQQQRQSNWLTANANELYVSTSEPIATTVVVTSSIVSTLTQTLPKVISIWFRNERIPTTIYSQTTTVMTDYITVTSTLDEAMVEPTAEWVRGRRDLNDVTLLDSSLLSEDDESQLKTRSLPKAESLGVGSAVPASWNQTRVAEAWNNLLDALNEARSNLNSK